MDDPNQSQILNPQPSSSTSTSIPSSPAKSIPNKTAAATVTTPAGSPPKSKAKGKGKGKIPTGAVQGDDGAGAGEAEANDDDEEDAPAPRPKSTKAGTGVKAGAGARAGGAGGTGGGDGDDDDDDDEGDDELPDLKVMQQFARQIQVSPATRSAPKINIPRRGEKDFEPLTQTALIQEKMLRESRQALFDGLGGVRGGVGCKHLSHAILYHRPLPPSPSSETESVPHYPHTPSSFPIIKLARGNLFLTTGHSIRPSAEAVERKVRLKLERQREMAQAGASAGGDENEHEKEKEGRRTNLVPGIQTTMELLPEEALYLLERGSLQIWQKFLPPRNSGSGSVQEEDDYEPEGMDDEWDESIEGVEGAVEMTVMEGFSRFVGMEGLSLEKYQVYAGLRRLGYTVQRTSQFLPHRFRKQAVPMPRAREGEDDDDDTEEKEGESPQADTANAKSTAVSTATTGGLSGLVRRFINAMRNFARRIALAFSGLLNLHKREREWKEPEVSEKERERRRGTLLGDFVGSTYGAMYEKLRVIPSGFTSQTPSSGSSPAKAEPTTATSADTDIYACLDRNPYLPFYNIWKPNTHWTRAKWDKGSDEGMKNMPPAFWVSVVDARSVPFPTLDQTTEVFDLVPYTPPPRIRPRAPPSSAKSFTTDDKAATMSAGRKVANMLHAFFGTTSTDPKHQRRYTHPTRPQGPPPSSDGQPPINTFAALKQGDKSFCIAVVDGGNVGWTRLGRGTFQDHVMVPNWL